jgi:NAD-dependent SIR2 family protein deacetylase
MTASLKVKSSDLLIVLGTSLKVFPFASLVGQASSDTPRVLINRENVGGIIMSEGESRDLFLEGDCDRIIRDILVECNWTEDFERIAVQIHEEQRV